MANEKRLIDANALIEHLNRCIETTKGLFRSVCTAIKCFVEQMPTVDAAEVVHGEWSTIEDDYCGMVALQCSECNQEYWFEDEPPIEIYHYCPNCGAKMDGEEALANDTE